MGRGDRWAAVTVLVLIVAGLVFINVYTKHPAGFFKSAYASVEIISTPTGARIFVDGMDNQQGKTPNTISLSPGTHTIVLKKAGYLTWEKKITAVSSVPMKVHAGLKGL